MICYILLQLLPVPLLIPSEPLEDYNIKEKKNFNRCFWRKVGNFRK